MTLFLIHTLLALAWMAVSGNYSLANLILGILLGGFALEVISRQRGEGTYLLRGRKSVALAWLFVIELIKSAWGVARIVIRPRIDIRPGIIAYRMQVKSDAAITLLANLITLTPGTLSVDVSPDRSTLYIHCVDIDDADAIRKDIADGFERRIMEVLET